MFLDSDQAGRPPCPLDPFFIMPDKCKCVDFQVLKLQESPDAVPHGEMPRHMQLYCDRWNNWIVVVEHWLYSRNHTKHCGTVLIPSVNFSLRFWLFFSLIFSRYLTEKVVPGNRVTVMGIYSIKKVSQKGDKVRMVNAIIFLLETTFKQYQHSVENIVEY